MNPTLLVVIVNYRTASLTIDCLYSLVSEVQALPGTKVVVSDNASGDNSIPQIQAIIDQEQWGDWVSLFLPLKQYDLKMYCKLIRIVLDYVNYPSVTKNQPQRH